MEVLEPMHLSLELLPGNEPIKGSLADETGVSRSFEGWIELAAVLEALMDSELQGPGNAHRAGTSPE